MGISMVDDPDEALHEFAVCSLLIGYFWFAKKLKKPPDFLLSCCLMPSFLLLLDGSFDATNGSLEGNSDGANAFDEVLLSLPAWFFASQPWKPRPMSFELPFESFINGIKFLELLQAWNLLEPLAVLALLMEQAANHVIFLLTWW